MKLSAPDDRPSDHRKFPVRALVGFALAHLLMGLVLQFIPFSKFQWAVDFFVPIDAALPAFRTKFLISENPVGCKVMLLLWWIVFVPWGVVLGRQFCKLWLSQADSNANRGLDPSPEAKIVLFVLGIFLLYFPMSMNSFQDYSYLLNPDRSASTIATDLRFGPLGVSWLKLVGSLALIGGSFLSVFVVYLHFFARTNAKGKFKK